MNLPNKITVFRLCMVIVVLATALINFPFHWCVTVVIYFIASMSDFVDGHIAREKKLVTDFGKLMDPLADKALVMTTFAIMLYLGYCNIICFSLILVREFLVSGIRMIAASKGEVIAANIFGKIKTIVQMTSTCLVYLGLALGEIFAINYNVLYILAQIMFWIACLFTVLSGLKYAKDGWYLIDSK